MHHERSAPSLGPALVSTLITALLLAGPALEAAAAPPPRPEPAYVLLVGNSFLRGIRRHLVRFYRDRGSFVRTKQNGPNGWTLARHAASGRTDKRIDQFDWDVIVLQEQSDGIDEERYPDSRVLDSKIQARGAETMFLMTWRNRGQPVEDYDSLHGQEGGSEGYVPIALELGAGIAPVGWAVRSAVAAGLPYDLWRDGHHLNKLGRYLAACVLYAALTRSSPVGLGAPAAFDPPEALYAQQLAEDTVLADLAEWNLTN
jgi:hypothetical protein